MICADCGQEKWIEKVHILIYDKPICNDCVDERENMALAKEIKERFESLKS
jgi:hypothetical protein